MPITTVRRAGHHAKIGAGMRPATAWFVLAGLLTGCAAERARPTLPGESAVAARPAAPNIVLIVADDLGYGDVGCFGAADIRTPNIDALAAEGMRFTDMMVPQAVCTASRAGLLSGCWPNRIGLHGALNHTSKTGIAAGEVLLSHVCRARGYATACFGKWHLGTRPEFLPLRRGFDEFAGLPYSNDNGPRHPTLPGLPPLPWIEGETVAETDPDQSQFTRRITDRAVAFIAANKSRPFLLYLPHVMPHVPIAASAEFAGKSKRGLYGDAVEELDASIGRVRDALRTAGVEDRTWIIFLSDNGPFLSYGNHAGSAGALREGKLTAFEGGLRTPCVMRWPGVIPAGTVCREPVCTIDILPTVGQFLAVNPAPHAVDGKSLRQLIKAEPGARSPHEALFCWSGDELHAVRAGDWKLHFPHDYLTVLAGAPGRDGKPAGHGTLKPLPIEQSGVRGIAARHGYEVRQLPLSLYNLRDDPGETKNVADANPDIVAKLTALAEPARRELGDKLTGVTGSGLREVGRVE